MAKSAKRFLLPNAFAVPACDEPTQMALKALQAGVASAGQQKTALGWIVNEAAAAYDNPYRNGGDGDRETAFACGRMFVGQQIVKQLNTVRVKPAA